ncbi:efflux RND transporter permease subunit [Aquabacter sp. CN5-332]|uniref:efflux RND transporter permease subunit n=1 Tax=Aquabacter sp. CN5-332 TaxID=3156608 RepID=UPI0032B405FF
MFWAIVRFSLEKRLFLLAVTAAMVIYGLLVARNMPIDLLPELRPPMVTVTVEANGLAPEEVEQLITVPVEMVMNGMPGVRRVRSTSAPGFAAVYVEFEWGTDPFRNRILVGERLALARDRLPAGVVPQIAPPASVMGLVMQVAVEGQPVDGVAADPMVIRDAADWVVRPRLLAVPGVSQVYVVGGSARQFSILPNPTAMRQLDITLEQIEGAVGQFGTNSSGGFIDLGATEFIIRNVGRSTSLDDLRDVVVAFRNSRPVSLSQVADVAVMPRVKRGEGSVDGHTAALLSIVKHPDANTVEVARLVAEAVAGLKEALPPGIIVGKVTYNQADLINNSVSNVEHALRDAIIIVAVVLMAFLMNLRSTAISLAAIPVSLLVTVLVFHLVGLSINTMTLGGIAIAIGQLVDDAVVNVENILRRLDENRRAGMPHSALQVIARALNEVRSGIVYATLIILLVFLPLFALPGEQGRLFAPLGIAYVVSILVSLLVSITVTPALCAYAFSGSVVSAHDAPGALVRTMLRLNARALAWALDRPRTLIAGTAVLFVATMGSVALLPATFLPPFNEGTLYVQVLNKPGLSLSESSRIGALAESILREVPEVVTVARRTGRNDGDEDADPITSSELPVTIRTDGRPRPVIIEDIRHRLAGLPVDVTVTQFLTSRMEVAANGVRGSIVLKIYGEDLETLRTLAGRFRQSFAAVPGMVDVLAEQQARVPQIRITVDYARAKLFGITPAAVTRTLESLSNGHIVSQVIDGSRRIDVVMRLSDADRTTGALAALEVETPAGRVPLSSIATVLETAGPNQIMHEDGKRRIVVSANVEGADTGHVVEQLRAIVASTPLPQGYRTSLEGSFRQQEQAQVLIPALSVLSLVLIFAVLRQRYRSAALSLVIMGNVPLALIGSVLAMWLWGVDLGLASMIGMVAVAGVAVRNGVLKISHFLNLALEGMPFGRGLIERGCAERLMPVLMTALSAGLALIPLLYDSDLPGMEILHPVAVAIFGGLVSATALDTLTTPVLFRIFGEKPVERLLVGRDATRLVETF